MEYPIVVWIESEVDRSANDNVIKLNPHNDNDRIRTNTKGSHDEVVSSSILFLLLLLLLGLILLRRDEVVTVGGPSKEEHIS